MTSAPAPSPLPDLRFDAVDLIGRPGAQRRIERTIVAPEIPDAPAGMWTEPGEQIAVDGSLESVVEGIYATGTVQAHVTGECSRCLDPLEADLDVRFDELFTYPEKISRDMSAKEREEIVTLEGDAVDLGPFVYDALVLAAPAIPLCREDCAGLCAQCGIRLEDDPGHHHDVIDDRFAALQGLFGTSTGETSGGSEGDADPVAPADSPRERPGTAPLPGTAQRPDTAR